MMWTSFMEDKSVDEQDDLLNDLYDQMFRVAYSKVRNKADALDIVQESWIKILQKIDTLKDRDKLVQWAKVIAANTAINLIKKRNARDIVQFDVQPFASDAQSVDAEIEDRLLQKTISESVAELDEETRKMFVCKYYYSLRDKEIAELMKIPIGTVKARIHRGKEKLRLKLLKVYEQLKHL